MSSPSRRSLWEEAPDEDSDSSDARMAMVDALEEMAADAYASGEVAMLEESDQDDDEEGDVDYQDADELDDDDNEEEEEDEEDEDDEDFDVDDMLHVTAVDLEGGEDEDENDDDDDDDEGDDDDDDDDDEDDGDDEDQTQNIISQILQQVLSGRNPADGAPGEEEEDGRTRSARAVRGIGLAGLRRLLLSQGAAARGLGGTDDDDDDDDDEESANWYGNTRSSVMHDFWDPIEKPVEAGQELALSGEFGKTPLRPPGSPPSVFANSRNIADRLQARKTSLTRVPKTDMDDLIPNSSGTEVARYPARVYCGQYSEDSSFFYTCTQDFRVQMYDTTAASSQRVLRLDDRSGYARSSRYYTSFGTTQYTSLKPIKTIQGRLGNWTITDANLSPDNRWMIYSSITPIVHLVPTSAEAQGSSDTSDQQVALDFGAGDDGGGVRSRSGIWSIRFSGDSREIVAGAHFGDIYVYDIEARRRVLRVEGHHDDVNGVAFADSASSNVLISGSDDSYVKVWDRRSLSGGKPAGVLPGHTEGITYVSPKGDGRYCISNGKDQSLRLWDLRNMKSSEEFRSMSKRDYGLRQWDYRNMHYRKPRFQSHPEDCSVMTYRGHAVLKTLIRCHFSPESTTGQKYIYSGSADGRIHVWSLDGRVVQVLDRNKATSIFASDVMASDPSAPDSTTAASTTGVGEPTAASTGYSRSYAYGRAGTTRFGTTVRDVSWHSSEASIMSTAWDGEDGQRGSIAKHEWKGYGKCTSLEDAVARSHAEAAEAGLS